MNRWDYLNMFKQPSTWAGFAVLFHFFGLNIAPESVVTAGTAIGGALAMLINEPGAK